MAIAAHNTQQRATAPVFTPTTITTAFSRLLGALAVLIEAERDIEEVDVWDIAFRAWMTDAERAHETVTDLLRTIRDATPMRATDLPLMRMSAAIEMLMGAESSAESEQAQRLIHDQRFHVGVSDRPQGRRIHALIATAQDRARELAALDAYRLDHDVDPEADALTDTWAA